MQENDGIQESNSKIPVGVIVFFAALVIWLVWYIYTYTPAFTGWSQYAVLEKESKERAHPVEKPATDNPYEKDEKAIAAGKTVYAANCSACHGDNLKGGVGSDLTARLKYGETDDKKYASISKGTPNGMPAFEQQLGRDRIWQVLAYIDSVREYGKKP